jgi:Domain of unknown function (DUF4167)
MQTMTEQQLIGLFQNAQKNYEKYLALARAETQIGNTIGAENYYQYAEHYLGRCTRTTNRGKRP